MIGWDQYLRWAHGVDLASLQAPWIKELLRAHVAPGVEPRLWVAAQILLFRFPDALAVWLAIAVAVLALRDRRMLEAGWIGAYLASFAAIHVYQAVLGAAALVDHLSHPAAARGLVRPAAWARDPPRRGVRDGGVRRGGVAVHASDGRAVRAAAALALALAACGCRRDKAAVAGAVDAAAAEVYPIVDGPAEPLAAGCARRSRRCRSGAAAACCPGRDGGDAPMRRPRTCERVLGAALRARAVTLDGRGRGVRRGDGEEPRRVRLGRARDAPSPPPAVRRPRPRQPRRAHALPLLARVPGTLRCRGLGERASRASAAGRSTAAALAAASADPLATLLAPGAARGGRTPSAAATASATAAPRPISPGGRCTASCSVRHRLSLRARALHRRPVREARRALHRRVRVGLALHQGALRRAVARGRPLRSRQSSAAERAPGSRARASVPSPASGADGPTCSIALTYGCARGEFNRELKIRSFLGALPKKTPWNPALPVALSRSTTRA